MERHILVVSDTHGSVPDWLCELQADTVLHAGDVGDLRTLDQFHCFETLFAVRGNTDVLLTDLPETVRTDIDGVRFFLVHNLTAPHRIAPGNAAALADWHPRIVVFGHTHQPLIREEAGVLYLNPGSLGKAGLTGERTYALVTVRERRVVRIEIRDIARRLIRSWPE